MAVRPVADAASTPATLRPSAGVAPYWSAYVAPAPPVATVAAIVAVPAPAVVTRGRDSVGLDGAELPVALGSFVEPVEPVEPVEVVEPVGVVDPVAGGVVVAPGGVEDPDPSGPVP